MICLLIAIGLQSGAMAERIHVTHGKKVRVFGGGREWVREGMFPDIPALSGPSRGTYSRRASSRVSAALPPPPPPPPPPRALAPSLPGALAPKSSDMLKLLVEEKAAVDGRLPADV